MKQQTAKDAANEVVSSGQPANDATGLATREQSEAVTEPQFSIGISEIMREKLSLDLQKTMHAIELGIGETSPTKVFDLGVSFYVIDGIYIDEFEDKKTGELKSKTVFRLECSDGVVRTIMQNAARPRRLMADACEQARALGGRFRSGPFKLEKKGVGNINDALIFAPQAGWRQTVE